MFSKIQVWKVTCEKCNKVFSSDDNEEDYFHTKKETIEIITQNDWHYRNGKAYCDECFIPQG